MAFRAYRWLSGKSIAAGLLAAITVPAMAAFPPLRPVQAPVPVLTWRACGSGFQCATAAVPLDYAHPRAQHIHLALIRLPAKDRRHRIGSIFVNPGGPGISGVTVVRDGARQIFTPQVRARFDIIGFDPRGVGGSTPVHCFASNREAQAFWAGVPGFPATAGQERAIAARAAAYGRRCQERAGDLLRHVTTTDVARDMDLLRTAAGDSKLTYWGLSYGSYLGQVYANLFPGRVRAMALDGVVDPREYAENSVAWIADMAVGYEHSVTSFLTECAAAGSPRCAFATAPASTATTLRHRLRRMLARLHRQAQPLPGSIPPQAITYQDLADVIHSAMDEPGSWPALAQGLEYLHDNDPRAAAVFRTLGLPPAALPPNAPYNNTPDASKAVLCTDTALPRNPHLWPVLARQLARKAPLSGPVALYAQLPCATWPARSAERYNGPWDRPTSAPILLVTVTGDPAAPYPGARRAAQELRNTRTLIVDGYGHTSIHAGSSCALRVENHYLLTGKPPAPRTHCPVDRRPFS